MPKKGPSPYKTMKKITITKNGVTKCFDRLNERKASGPDKIPITFLKQTSEIITPLLCSIFQKSLDTGVAIYL